MDHLVVHIQIGWYFNYMPVGCGAHSTDLAHPENVNDLCSKCHNISRDWKVTADKLWKKEGHEIKEESRCNKEESNCN